MLARKLTLKFDYVLYVTLAVFALGFIVVGHLSFSALKIINAEREYMTEKNARAVALTNHLRYLKAEEDAQALRFILTKDNYFISKIRTIREEFVQHAEKIKELDQSPEALQWMTEIMARKTILNEEADLVMDSRLKGASMQQANRRVMEKIGASGFVLEEELNKFFEYEIARFTTARQNIEKSVNELSRGLIVASSLTFLGFVFMIGLLVGLTRIRKANEAAKEKLLEQSQLIAQARKEILEIVAHDLKNPIGAIQMSMEMILENPQAPVQESHEYFSIINQSTQVMGRLVNDLLDHAKIESGHLTIQRQFSDVSQAVDHLIQRFTMVAQSKGVKIELDIPDEDFCAEFDEARVDQLLSNLLSNALKFTPANGAVTIALRGDDENIEVSVRDSGVGMDDEAVRHIFDRYWQVRKTASQGTGLGLAICKAIADAHEGDLWVESKPGRGSKFYFRLPRYPGLTAPADYENVIL